MEAPDCLWEDEKKESFFLICLAVGGLISQREGRNGSERDKDGRQANG